jgi:hypothetical protein
MKRLILITIAVVVAVGLAVPHIDIDFMRPRIERAIERSLGRRVEVGKVYMNLFTGPGFTVEDLTVHEDPRAGIEPFIYVRSLEARVRLLSLFSKRLAFSSLRMSEDANINLVKTAAGPWNFQFLLGGAPAETTAITMRGGRVNFKFGDTKSVFYFNDADLDVSPSGDGSIEVRFSGAPSRTDQAQQNFGHFFVRGKWDGQKLDMRVELERSAFEEVARLLDQRGFGLHGTVALDAQLSGAPSKLDVAGTLQVEDVHRWDLLPKRGGAWGLSYKGALDLRGETLELSSVSDAPNPQLGLKFSAHSFLSTPHWEAGADMNRFPVAWLVAVAQHMGTPIPETMTAEGTVSGSVKYADTDDLSGQVNVEDAAVTIPEAQPLHAANASVMISGKTFKLESTTVEVGHNETAEVEGSFQAGEGLDVRIATRGLNVADLRSLGLGSIPVLAQSDQGSWRGWARYHWNPETGTESGPAAQWTGEYELQNARVDVQGFAAPLRIQSASVSCANGRVAVTRIRARLGDLPITGEYRWERAAVRPHHFKIAIANAKAAELEELLAPTLVRERGFLARTLRFGPAPVPAWIAERRADGTISIDSLAFGGTQVKLDSARVLWDGPQVRLAHLIAHGEAGSADGELTVELTNRVPHYRFDGKIADLSYKGGRLTLDGTFQSDGTGGQLLVEARGAGSFRGKSVAFTPEIEFRGIAGCFDMLPGPRLKISCLEATQNGETYTGSGATQADGRLVLDLTTRGRQVHYTGALLAGASPQ